MSEFAHQSGKPLDCLCMALKIYKQEATLRSGEKIFKIGMSIGGGVDQDCSKSIYKDNVKRINSLVNILTFLGDIRNTRRARFTSRKSRAACT